MLVETALEREGAASLRELLDLTGLDAHDCGEALDALRIAGKVAIEDGAFCWVGSELVRR